MDIFGLLPLKCFQWHVEPGQNIWRVGQGAVFPIHRIGDHAVYNGGGITLLDLPGKPSSSMLKRGAWTSFRT